MTLGERLRRLRERRHLSQLDLARLASVDRTWIFRLENGERHNISLEAAKRLAKSLGVSLDVLAGMYEDEIGSKEEVAGGALVPA